MNNFTGNECAKELLREQAMAFPVDILSIINNKGISIKSFDYTVNSNNSHFFDHDHVYARYEDGKPTIFYDANLENEDLKMALTRGLGYILLGYIKEGDSGLFEHYHAGDFLSLYLDISSFVQELLIPNNYLSSLLSGAEPMRVDELTEIFDLSPNYICDRIKHLGFSLKEFNCEEL